jgi:hypothetical protein
LFTGATNIIQLYDLKHPSKGRYRIGWLALRKSSLPFPKAFDVANVNIDEQYRGQGLGQTMYGIAMKLLGITIVADETQTNAARRMWVYLSKIPGVEINGYTTIWADNWDKRATPDEIDDYDDLRLIKALIRGGGKEFGRKHNSVYVSFPVTGNVNQSELRAINNGLAIYSAQHPEFGGTQNGLYARWVGI